MNKFFLKLFAVALLGVTINAQAVLIYNNSVNDNTNRLGAVDNLWFGDEVTLGNPTSDRFMTHFDFQYWAIGTSGLTIDVELRYNDGSLFNGYPRPNTLIYSYSGFAIGNTSRSTINFEIADLDLFDTVNDGGTLLTSDTLTLAVRFNFNGNPGTAGVDLYGPPTVGSSYFDYWQFTGGNWELTTNNVFSVVNFGMRIEAVPEPTAMTIFLLGGAVAMGFRRYFSKK